MGIFWRAGLWEGCWGIISLLQIGLAWGRKQDSIDQLHFTHGETIAQSKEVIHPQSQAAGAKCELGLQALRPEVSALRYIPV